MSKKKVGPYQTKKRAGSVPHVYSDAYRAWKRAAMANGSGTVEARHAHDKYISNRFA